LFFTIYRHKLTHFPTFETKVLHFIFSTKLKALTDNGFSLKIGQKIKKAVDCCELAVDNRKK
jgi:hypothetical protein